MSHPVEQEVLSSQGQSRRRFLSSFISRQKGIVTPTILLDSTPIDRRSAIRIATAGAALLFTGASIAHAQEESSDETEAFSPPVPKAPENGAQIVASTGDTEGEVIFSDDFTTDRNVFPTFSHDRGSARVENGKYISTKTASANAGVRTTGQNEINFWEKYPGQTLRFEIIASSPANPANFEYPLFYLGNTRNVDTTHAYIFGVLPNGKTRVTEWIGSAADRNMFPRDIWDNVYPSIKRGSNAENLYAIEVTSSGNMQFLINKEPVGPQISGNPEVIARGFGVGVASRPGTPASASFDNFRVTIANAAG